MRLGPVHQPPSLNEQLNLGVITHDHRYCTVSVFTVFFSHIILPFPDVLKLIH